ncbi:MAG: hypothetical protein KF788_06150 [Piscinibacter sp.]|nr:hypothetical protein [Piscinibacter sp.]
MQPSSWRGRTVSLLVLPLLLAGLAACSRGGAPVMAEGAGPAERPIAAPAPEAELALILPDLMDLGVDPAAGVLFAAVAREGAAPYESRNDEAWQATADAAAELVRFSGLLADPALAGSRADWRQWAAAMRDGAALAGAAARRRDARSLFAAGAQVRASCQACHARFAPAGAESLAVPQAPHGARI